MTTTVLASDPSITYSPHNAWTSSGNGTITTTHAGATAQLTFNGVFIQVFGTIPSTEHPPPRPVSNYTLDLATPVVFNSTDFSDNQLITNHVFYQSSPDLESGGHTLVITAVTDQSDFILSSIVHVSGISVSNSIPSSSTNEDTPTSSPRASASQTVAHPAIIIASKVPVAVIIGGIIATLVVLVVAFMFYRLYRRRKMSISAGAQGSTSDFQPSPEPFLLDVPSETRANGGVVWFRESFVSLNLSPALNEDSEWKSIPHSVSTAPAVFGDRSYTSSFVDEKKDGSELANCPPMPVALKRHSTVLTTGTRWTTQSGPPPSWTALSDAPPSYTR